MYENSWSYQFNEPSSLFGAALAVLLIVAWWFTFEKAGRHGWAAVIPFYNVYVLCKVAGKPGWWWVLWLIPIVNIVIGIIVARGVGRNFGKGAVFSFFLLFLLPYVGYPILAWGNSRYEGEAPGTAVRI